METCWETLREDELCEFVCIDQRTRWTLLCVCAVYVLTLNLGCNHEDDSSSQRDCPELCVTSVRACLYACVFVFVSSARGQTLSETSWCSGHCWSVGRCVRCISWALKCFRSNHLFLSVLYLFSFGFCLHFPLAMDFLLLVYRSLLVSFLCSTFLLLAFTL